MDDLTSGSDTRVLKNTPNNGLVSVHSSTLNRAALFGDGVFETMVFIGVKIRFAKEHENRLNLGLSLLKIQPSLLSIKDLEAFIRKYFKKNISLRIRWNVYRGGLGKYTPHADHAEETVLIQK